MAKKMYIGAPKSEVVNSTNLAQWFTFSDPDGISSWNGNTITITGTYENERVKFTALQDMTISFDYTTDSFSRISLAGQYICEDDESGTYTGTLKAGKYFYFSIGSTTHEQTGTFSNITCTSTNSVARKVKKIYVGVENFKQVTLPTAYTQVGYIQSSGTQHIDTGFKPNQDTRVVMDAQMVSSSNSQFYFGSRTSSNTVNYGLLINTDARRTDYGESKVIISGASVTDRVLIDKNKNICTVGGVTVTNDSSTFQSAYNLFLFASNDGGTAKYNGSLRVYSCKIYDNGTLTRNYIPCTNASGTVGLYDTVNGKFYTNAGSGTFTAGTSVQSTARRVKKGYISIGGVARPFFGSGLDYYGTITPLNGNAAGTGSYNLGAVTHGGYAIFAGGHTGSSAITSLATAYDSSLTASKPAGLKDPKSLMGVTAVGNYAIFAGGMYSTSSSGTVKTVYGYTKSLSMTTFSSLSVARHSLAGTTVGDYAVFAGGVNPSSTVQNSVDTYNGSGTKGTASSITFSAYDLSATTVGGYALFAGGCTNKNGVDSSTYRNKSVNAYDSSLTRSTPTSLDSGKLNMSATTVGDYALFAGGYNGNYVKTVVAYNSSLTQTLITDLSVDRSHLTATTLGDYALFAGGLRNGGNDSSAVVDIYDKSLTRTVPTGLSVARHALASTTIGNYALFGGGATGTASSKTKSDVVDAYTIL